MGLMQIKREASKLPPRKLKLLDEWLHELLRKAEGEAGVTKRKPARGKAIEERAVGNKRYRLQGVRCGKENCRCARGKLHGPYWYSYARSEGKIKSQYVGKKLPSGVKKGLKS